MLKIDGRLQKILSVKRSIFYCARYAGNIVRYAVGCALVLLILPSPAYSNDCTHKVEVIDRDGNDTNDPLTLRAAIRYADQNDCNVSEIKFDESIYDENGYALIVIDEPLKFGTPQKTQNRFTIIGPDPDSGKTLEIQTSGSFRHFYVVDEHPHHAALKISNLTLKSGAANGGNGGDASYSGGAGGGGAGLGGSMFVDGDINLELENVAFVDNAANGGDGGRATGDLATPSDDNLLFYSGGGGGGAMGGLVGSADGTDGQHGPRPYVPRGWRQL